ncbi:MAG: DoxX family protein [Alphaproteobacteria bacterium]|nr:DoxX family protein [Alphaproteobacteria bacterium]
MRAAWFGRVLFAVGCALLGALTLSWHDFYREWLPLAKELGGYGALTTVFGIFLVAGGIGLLISRTVRPAAFALALVMLVLLLAKLPVVATHPLVEGVWEDFSESLVYLAGAWTLFWLPPRASHTPSVSIMAGVGQILFAVALPALGLSHLVYLNLTTPLIPSWLPFHVGLAYFTGAAHIAAGVGILFGLMPRLAAVLEALMVTLFTLLVWVPLVAPFTANRFEWSEFCVSTIISGSAWIIAASLRERPWLDLPGPRKVQDLLRWHTNRS